MDEILFENVFTADAESSAQIAKMTTGKARTALLIALVILFVNYVRDAYLEFVQGYGYFYLVLCLVWLGLILYLFFQPRIVAMLHIRRANKFYDGELPENRILFTGEAIAVNSGNNQFRLPYAKLTRVRSSGNVVMLMANKFTYVSIRTDRFTKGTYEEFLVFLKAKCPNLKISG